MEKLGEVHRQRMEHVAAQENNVVYKYEYGVPERSADIVQAMKLAKMTLEERAKSPHLSDEAAASHLTRNFTLISTFSRTHPVIFEKMCTSGSCGESYAMLTRLSTFGLSTPHMPLPDATAKVSQFLMQECARGTAPDGEENSKDEAGLGSAQRADHAELGVASNSSPEDAAQEAWAAEPA
jgi:hypothetical protein